MLARLTTKDDLHLPYYSHSIMTAINTCPKWGIIRYKKKLYFRQASRAMALEAGSAMHEAFAALRLWQLYRLQNLYEHFLFHGKRLFNTIEEPNRFENCIANFQKSDPRDEALNFLYEILNSGTFYDDPRDRIRTIGNMEETLVRYVDELWPTMKNNPIWVEDPLDPTALVGIEIPFDMVIDNALRYIGTIDGICQRPEQLRIEENKTASRLDEAWRNSFDVSAQPTGYMVAARALTGQSVDTSRVIGVKVKQTKSNEDMLVFSVDRSESQIASWYRTLLYTHRVATEFVDEPLLAPEFTHSCNRYFRSCAFTPLCSSDMDDQEAMLESMEPAPPSPSEERILEKWK